MSRHLTKMKLDYYADAIARYRDHVPVGFACCSAHPAAEAAGPLLDEVKRLTDRVETLEAVAAGNKRHVQELIPLLDRIRALHTSELSNEFGATECRTCRDPWPCETAEILSPGWDGVATPEQTAIDAVRTLHQSFTPINGVEICSHCTWVGGCQAGVGHIPEPVHYPCPTIQALNGEGA